MIKRLSVIVGLIVAIICGCTVAVAQASDYRVTGTIVGPDFRWDYLSVDSKARRLYVATGPGVASVNLRSSKLTPVLVTGKRNHGVVPIPGTSTAVTTSGAENALIWFHGDTGAVIASFPTGKEPDAVVYEPATRTVLTMNQRSDDATIVDLQTRSVVGTIPLAGSPEFAVADGSGLVYDNIEDKNEIAVIDVRARKIVREIPLRDCRRPTGLAYDARTGLLLSACVNGVLDAVSANTGKDVGALKIGKGADAVILDSARRLAFVPCGGSGTLSVIALKSAKTLRVVETVKTKLGVRTGAVDEATGTLYLPSADFLPARKGPWPDVVPGTVKFLIVSPSKH